MAQQLEPVTFDEFLSNAASIFAQIEQEGKDVLVERDGTLFSVKMKQPKTKKRSRALTSQDSLLHIIGIGASQGPTDTSSSLSERTEQQSTQLLSQGTCPSWHRQRRPSFVPSSAEEGRRWWLHDLGGGYRP